MVETSKAFARRLREGFFTKYCMGTGIDIGCGDDPLDPKIDKWDFKISKDQNAENFTDKNIPNEIYDFVYSSHCLEDLSHPGLAIQNWWRILKPGGYLILYIPHRDLFEHSKVLPSTGNFYHKWYFLIDRYESPVTIGLIPFLNQNLADPDIIYVKKCDEGYWYDQEKFERRKLTGESWQGGEYSIECVVRKKLERLKDDGWGL